MENTLEKLNRYAVNDHLLKLEARLNADVFSFYGPIVNGVERQVKDLIESLKSMNPDADVGIKTIDDVYVDQLYLSYICIDENGDEISEMETKQVWIESVDLCCNCQFFDNNYCNAYDCDTCDVEECFQFHPC